MNTKTLIDTLKSKGWTVNELESGKVRFSAPNETTYLLSPVDAVRYGTWLNEKTLLTEALPA
jgi:hypothetical protein